MISQFYDFHSIALGTAQILVITLIGAFLYNRKLITHEGNKTLSNVLFAFFLPSIIFYKIVTLFDPYEIADWWVLPLASIIIAFLGGVCAVFVLPLLKIKKARRELVVTSAFHNCAYLPMTLVAFVCTGEVCNLMLVFIFLYTVGFNIVIWSFAPYFLAHEKVNVKGMLAKMANMPALATVFSVLSVFVFGTNWCPTVVTETLKLAGDATFPVALIVLGVSLAHHKGYFIESWRAFVGSLGLRLIIVPAIVLGVLFLIELDPRLEFIIFLQSTMPSAVSLVVIGEQTKADLPYISRLVFYSHICAIATIPLWLSLYEKM